MAPSPQPPIRLSQRDRTLAAIRHLGVLMVLLCCCGNFAAIIATAATSSPSAAAVLRRVTLPLSTTLSNSSLPSARACPTPPIATTTQAATQLYPRCSDGSNYAYFFADAPAASAASEQQSLGRNVDYVIYLDGTATTCSSDSECSTLQAHQPELFTSSFQLETMTGGDLLSAQDLGASVAQAARVFLPYCTQDMWLGSSSWTGRSAVTSARTLRGDDNWWAVWSQLDIHDAWVVLAGSAAGATAVTRLAAVMAASGELQARNVTLSLLLDSAWMVDYRSSVSDSLPGSASAAGSSGQLGAALDWWQAAPGLSASKMCSLSSGASDYSDAGNSNNAGSQSGSTSSPYPPLCSANQSSASSALKDGGKVSCCLDIGCLLQHWLYVSQSETNTTIANKTTPGTAAAAATMLKPVTGAFVAASLYDPWVLQLWQTRNPTLAAQIFSTQLDSIYQATPIITVVEEYGGYVRQALEQAMAQLPAAVTFYVPPCLQGMWLQPNAAAASTLTMPPFQYVRQASLWSAVQVQGTNLQQAVSKWLEDQQQQSSSSSSSSSNDGGSSGSVSYVSTCYGAGCNQSCPSADAVQSIALDEFAWADSRAVSMLIFVGCTAAFCILVVIAVLLWAVRFRAAAGWQRGVNGGSNSGGGSGSKNSGKNNESVKDKDTSTTSNNAEPDALLSHLEHVPRNEQLRLSCHHLSYWNSAQGSPASTTNGKHSKPVLDDVSVVANPGEVTALMGVSGCGKTTLLEMLGLRRTFGVYTSSVCINGVPYAQGSTRYRDLAYVRQDGGGFLEHLTVLDNMMYASLLRAPELTAAQHKQRVLEMLRNVGLEHTQHFLVGGDGGAANYMKKAATISGGQRRRLSVALELLTDPKVLLMDEPTSGLDASSALQLLKMLNAFCATGRTLILSIHQPRVEIFNMFDKVVLMKAGKMIVSDSPEFIVRSLLRNIPVRPGTNAADTLSDVLHLGSEDILNVLRKLHKNKIMTPNAGEIRYISSLNKVEQAKADALVLKGADSGRKESTTRTILCNNLWRGVSLSATQFCACLDRASTGLWALTGWACFFLGSMGLVFGALAYNTNSPTSMAGILYSFFTIYNELISIFVVRNFDDSTLVFNKDCDVVDLPKSFLLCFSFLVYVFFFAIPASIVPVLALGLTVNTRLGFAKLVSTLDILFANYLSVVLISILCCLFFNRLGVASTFAKTTLALTIVVLLGIISGFYVPFDKASPWLSWAFYICPTYYSFSSALRVLLEGIPQSSSLCSVSASGGYGNALFCSLSNADNFLNNLGFNNVDVGKFVGIQVAFWGTSAIICIGTFLFPNFNFLWSKKSAPHKDGSNSTEVIYSAAVEERVRPIFRWHRAISTVIQQLASEKPFSMSNTAHSILFKLRDREKKIAAFLKEYDDALKSHNNIGVGEMGKSPESSQDHQGGLVTSTLEGRESEDTPIMRLEDNQDRSSAASYFESVV